MKVSSQMRRISKDSALEYNGYEVIYEHDIPFSRKEWEQIERLTTENNLSYVKVYNGDTSEALSLNVFRVKKPGLNEIYHDELMEIVGSKKMLDFYRQICKNNKLKIDRCQVHLYKKNDYIARHIDKESYEGYLYSLLFAISDNFSGGEMILYNKKGSADKFVIQNHSLLLFDSDIPHEVLPIKSGIRKTLAMFLME